MATRQATQQSTQRELNERGADATRRLRDALRLPLAGTKDIKLLGTALAEVAADESDRNPRFAEAVRQRYTELVQLQSHEGSRPTATTKASLPPLVPIRRDTTYREIDPFKPPDPEFLIYVYGHKQLARALQDYTVESLKLAAAELEKQHPGTKPMNRGRKDPIIAYIVEYSAKE